MKKSAKIDQNGPQGLLFNISMTLKTSVDRLGARLKC
jgi:hypothetical protein